MTSLSTPWCRPCPEPESRKFIVTSGMVRTETLVPKFSYDISYVAIAALTPVFTTILTVRVSASRFVPMKSIITIAAVEEDRTIEATLRFASMFPRGPDATVERKSCTCLFVVPRRFESTRPTLQRNTFNVFSKANTRSTFTPPRPTCQWPVL